MMPPALELHGVRRVFKTGGTEIAVLNGVDLALRAGEVVALVGPSGAGKSTMLHIAGLLERPDGGSVSIGGQECGSLSDQHSAPCCVAPNWVSSISSIICCRNFRRSKTSCCRR